MGVGEFAQFGVPVGFQCVSDEAVGGVDGQVASAGQLGVVVCALHVGGADTVGVGGLRGDLVGDGQGDVDGQRGQGLQNEIGDGPSVPRLYEAGMK